MVSMMKMVVITNQNISISFSGCHICEKSKSLYIIYSIKTPNSSGNRTFSALFEIFFISFTAFLIDFLTFVRLSLMTKIAIYLQSLRLSPLNYFSPSFLDTISHAEEEKNGMGWKNLQKKYIPL